MNCPICDNRMFETFCYVREGIQRYDKLYCCTVNRSVHYIRLEKYNEIGILTYEYIDGKVFYDSVDSRANLLSQNLTVSAFCRRYLHYNSDVAAQLRHKLNSIGYYI